MCGWSWLSKSRRKEDAAIDFSAWQSQQHEPSTCAPPFEQAGGVLYACRALKPPVSRIGGGPQQGERTMTRVLNEILLLSCMAVFVTGIVVAAASLLT
jgi:hypothetical protein